MMAFLNAQFRNPYAAFLTVSCHFHGCAGLRADIDETRC
jgi:hypothetical protein